MKSIAKIALVASALLAASPALAGLRFNHVLYECTLAGQSEGADVTAIELQVLTAVPDAEDARADLQGRWFISAGYKLAEDPADRRGRVIIASGTARSGWLNPSVVTVKDRAEILGEDPRSVSLTLDKKTGEGEVTLKAWRGYSPIGSPDFWFSAPLACQLVDRPIR